MSYFFFLIFCVSRNFCLKAGHPECDSRNWVKQYLGNPFTLDRATEWRVKFISLGAGLRLSIAVTLVIFSAPPPSNPCIVTLCLVWGLVCWRVFQCFLRVCFTLSFSASLYTGTSGSSFFMLSTICLVEEVEVKGCVHSPCPALALDRLWVPVVELFQWSCLFPRSRPLLSPRVGFFHFSFLQPQCIWTCVLTTTDFTAFPPAT